MYLTMDRKNCNYCLALLSVLLAILGAVGGLKCLRCNTLQHHGCEKGDREPEECDNDVNPTCFIFVGKLATGKLSGEALVYRDCGTEESMAKKSRCTNKKLQDHEVDVCYKVCNTSGCNSGPINSAVTFSASPLRTLWMSPLLWLGAIFVIGEKGVSPTRNLIVYSFLLATCLLCSCASSRTSLSGLL